MSPFRHGLTVSGTARRTSLSAAALAVLVACGQPEPASDASTDETPLGELALDTTSVQSFHSSLLAFETAASPAQLTEAGAGILLLVSSARYGQAFTFPPELVEQAYTRGILLFPSRQSGSEAAYRRSLEGMLREAQFELAGRTLDELIDIARSELAAVAPQLEARAAERTEAAAARLRAVVAAGSVVERGEPFVGEQALRDRVATLEARIAALDAAPTELVTAFELISVTPAPAADTLIEFEPRLTLRNILDYPIERVVLQGTILPVDFAHNEDAPLARLSLSTDWRGENAAVPVGEEAVWTSHLAMKMPADDALQQAAADYGPLPTEPSAYRADIKVVEVGLVGHADGLRARLDRATVSRLRSQLDECDGLRDELEAELPEARRKLSEIEGGAASGPIEQKVSIEAIERACAAPAM